MPDRNLKRPGGRRWLPRAPRQLGYRGRILLIFGIAWALIGVGVVTTDPAPTPGVWHLSELPESLRASLWIVTGSLAVATAWRPPGFTDAVGWTALYTMPMVRTISYTMAWADSVIPYGGQGYSRGWVLALLHVAMVAAVWVCSGWPEPPTLTLDKRRRSKR